jgi:hypothetical protein
LSTGAFGDKTAGGHQFAYLGARAIGAGRGFLAEDQTFELAAAIFALVFEDGHVLYSLFFGADGKRVVSTGASAGRF